MSFLFTLYNDDKIIEISFALKPLAFNTEIFSSTSAFVFEIFYLNTAPAISPLSVFILK